LKAPSSLNEQIGQMMVSGFHGTSLDSQTEDLIVNHHVGGLILFERNFENPEQLTRLISDLQKLALSTPPFIPLFISVDQEGGRVSRLQPHFTRFPTPGCLGKARSESLARRFGLALGREMRAVGINMDYAPVLDVNTNPKNPIIGTRAFSNTPEWAARLGVGFLNGFREAGVIAVGKHFPGHGDTSQDSHLTLPTVDRDAETLTSVELVPFQSAIDHGLDVIMTAHVIYKAWDEKFPATFSVPILKNLLRGKLGFEGLIMSDDLEMKAVQDHIPYEDYPTLGTEAGIDLFLICHDTDKVKALLKQMERDVSAGKIPQATIETSLQRILAIKKRMPHFESGLTDLASLSTQHRNLVDEMQSYLAS
jgi:beta-N-acetylhexosaminidase